MQTILVGFLWLVGGCTDDKTLSRISVLEQHGIDMRREIGTLREEIGRLRTETNNIGFDLFSYKLDNDRTVAYFDPASSGFSRVDTETGHFLVSMKDIKPYADGHRITLKIGNPMAADFQDMKIKVKWGKRYDRKTHGEYDAWMKTLRETQTTISGNTKAGAWNQTTVVLSPSTPEEIGTIRVSLDTSVVSLKTH